MIYDLAAAESPITIDADVGVIGGGTVGLLIADRLARKGLRVVVLESGSDGELERSRELNQIECTHQLYRGATEGRARGLGGTSQLWGGALIPFLPIEFEERSETGIAAWPVDSTKLASYVLEIEEIFGVVEGSYEGWLDTRGPSIGRDEDFVPRQAKWPSFWRRNVGTLLGDRLKRLSGPEVWLNATVVDFRMTADSSHLDSVSAVADGGKRLALSAKCFVLCAGAIETTRLMLFLARQTGHSERFSTSLGCYFHDHLSRVVAQLRTRDQMAVNRIFGFRFQRRTMRSLRFELSPQARRREALPGGFCHISFQPVEEAGVDQLRSVLRGVQAGRVELGQAVGLLRSTPYLTRLAYWLAMRRQFLWPTPSLLSLHAVVEQIPRARNRITLSDRLDRFHVPLVSLAWSIDDEDSQTLDSFAERFGRFWARGPLAGLGGLEPNQQVDTASDGSLSVDIYHPGGSTRMGHDQHSAVVDGNLRVWSMPNLYIASTSTFPTGGAANPTMTLLLFGLRLADHLAKDLERTSGMKTCLGS